MKKDRDLDKIEEKINESDVTDIVRTAIGDIYAWATFERGFPDITDGFKSSVRRILTAMIDSGCDKHNGRFIKCSSVVGNCLAKYHPHGDASLYQTLISLGQEFDLNYPLITAGGNFGNHKGDDYAAIRYTECKASEFGEDVIFKDYNKNIMDFKSAEIPDYEEPVWFSTRIPLVLLEGSTGIGEAFVCSIPPHNITDVVRMCIEYIKNPNISEEVLLNNVYPDYPCGGIITNGKEVKDIYLNKEKGTVKLKADIVIDHENNLIIVREFPNGCNCNKLKEELFNLSEKSYHITKINSIIDKTSSKYKELNEAYIYCNKDANLNEIYKILITKTSLKNSQNISFRLYDSGKVVLLSVKSIIDNWYRMRKEYLRREYSFKKSELEVRIHILEGLLKIYDFTDEITKALKEAENKDDAIRIINEIVPSLSKIQSKSIAELQLYRISKRSKEDILNEINSLTEKIKEYERLLQIIPNTIIDQLLELENKYHRPRRTKIIMDEADNYESVDISNKVLLYTKFSYKINDIDTFINSKNIINGLSSYKFENHSNKEIINYEFIKDNCKGLLFFFNDGTYNYINNFDSLNYWNILSNILDKTFINQILPIYNEDDSILFLKKKKKLKRVAVKEFLGKGTCTEISNALYIESNYSGMIMIIDENSNYLLFDIEEDNIPILNKKAAGVLTNFDENVKTFMIPVNPYDKNVILFYENNECSFMNIVSEESLIVSSRNNKLKSLNKQIDQTLKLTGVSILKMPNKNTDYNTIIIGKNNILKINSRNLKFLNEYRKISLSSLGIIQFKI